MPRFTVGDAFEQAITGYAFAITGASFLPGLALLHESRDGRLTAAHEYEKMLRKKKIIQKNCVEWDGETLRGAEVKASFQDPDNEFIIIDKIYAAKRGTRDFLVMDIISKISQGTGRPIFILTGEEGKMNEFFSTYLALRNRVKCIQVKDVQSSAALTKPLPYGGSLNIKGK